MDNIEWLDFDDTDYLDILEEVGRSSNPSQVRVYQMWNALANENRVQKETIEDLNSRQLIKRHHDLQAMVQQRELTQESNEAYLLLKGQIKDLDDKMSIKQVVEQAEIKCEKPNRILDNLKQNLNQYNFSHEAPSVQKAKKFEADLSNLIGRAGPNQFNRKLSRSLIDLEESQRSVGTKSALVPDPASGYGGAKFKKFGVDFDHSDVADLSKEPYIYASPQKTKKAAPKKTDPVSYSQKLNQKSK